MTRDSVTQLAPWRWELQARLGAAGTRPRHKAALEPARKTPRGASGGCRALREGAEKPPAPDRAQRTGWLAREGCDPQEASTEQMQHSQEENVPL